MKSCLTIANLFATAIWLTIAKRAEAFIQQGPQLRRCYGKSPDQNLLPYVLEQYAVNSRGERCYTPIDEDSAMGLLHKATFEDSYSKLEKNFCPLWRGNKRCLSYHLKSKCRTYERKEIKESVLLNVLILFAELVCEPGNTSYERMVLKLADNAGISTCVDNGFFQNATTDCSMKLLAENNGRYPPFSKYIARNSECLKPKLELCKEYNPALANLWNEMIKALISASDSFWRKLFSHSPALPKVPMLS